MESNPICEASTRLGTSNLSEKKKGGGMQRERYRRGQKRTNIGCIQVKKETRSDWGRGENAGFESPQGREGEKKGKRKTSLLKGKKDFSRDGAFRGNQTVGEKGVLTKKNSLRRKKKNDEAHEN